MLENRAPNEAAFQYYAKLGKVKRYVDQRYFEYISLENAAQIACLEKKYFSAFFHAKTGVRFKEWLNSVRIAHAIELMKVNNNTIVHIALAVGFRDVRTFERVFKKHEGVTPSAFKNLVRPC